MCKLVQSWIYKDILQILIEYVNQSKQSITLFPTATSYTNFSKTFEPIILTIILLQVSLKQYEDTYWICFPSFCPQLWLLIYATPEYSLDIICLLTSICSSCYEHQVFSVPFTECQLHDHYEVGTIEGNSCLLSEIQTVSCVILWTQVVQVKNYLSALNDMSPARF